MNDKVNENPRSCATCYFSNTITATGPNGETIIGQEQLICMRRPPAVLLKTIKMPLGEQDTIVTQFPPVTKEMFCYDYWPEHLPLPIEQDFDLVTGVPINDN